MEPIRPDHDEVAARHSQTERGRPTPPRSEPGTSPRSGRSNSAGRVSVVGLVSLVLLALLVLIGGWLLVKQYRTIEQLQADVSEAEDWISRTKLSMARFEGRLSEADRELLESGSEITGKLEFLDSEMRKLWGVSNDRNRKAIKANQEAVAFLEDKTDYLDKQRAELSALLEKQRARDAGLESDLGTLRDRVGGLAAKQEEIESAFGQVRNTLQSVASTQQELQGRINNVVQRQTLGTDELRARLDAVEKRLASSNAQAELKRLEARLSDLQEVVNAIDASRSQFTGRLLRLEERVQSAAGQ